MAAETNERLATLETQMGDVRFTLSKREDYQNSVLEKLAEIKWKQDQFLDYQRTCDASREAHGKRIGDLEDARMVEAGARKLIRSQAISVSALLSLAISVAAILYGRH